MTLCDRPPALQVREASEPSLELSRATALFHRPMAFSAPAELRNATSSYLSMHNGYSSSNSNSNSNSGSGSVYDTRGLSGPLEAFVAGHPAAPGGGGGREGALDSGATGIFTGAAWLICRDGQSTHVGM